MPAKTNTTSEEYFKEGTILFERNFLYFPMSLINYDDNATKVSEVTNTRLKTHINYQFLDHGKKRFWRILPDAHYKYPRNFDDVVRGAVQKLLTDGAVMPRLYEIGGPEPICKVLGLSSKSEDTKQRVRDSLNRWAATTIQTNAFTLNKEGNVWTPTGPGGTFSLWNLYWKNDPLPGNDLKYAKGWTLEFSHGFQQGYGSPLAQPRDFSYWLSMKKKPLKRRLYELSGLGFNNLGDSPGALFDVQDLCGRAPIILQSQLGKMQSVFKDSFDEFIQDEWFSKDGIEWRNSDQKHYNPKHPWQLKINLGKRAQREQKITREHFIHTKQIEGKTNAAKEMRVARSIERELGGENNMGSYRIYARLLRSQELPFDFFREVVAEGKARQQAGKLESGKDALPAWVFRVLQNRLWKEHNQSDLKALFKRERSQKKEVAEDSTNQRTITARNTFTDMESVGQSIAQQERFSNVQQAQENSLTIEQRLEARQLATQHDKSPQEIEKLIVDVGMDKAKQQLDSNTPSATSA